MYFGIEKIVDQEENYCRALGRQETITLLDVCTLRLLVFGA